MIVHTLLVTSTASAISFTSAGRSPVTDLGPNGTGAISGNFGGDEASDIVSVTESEGPSVGGGIYMLINDGNGYFSETETSACDPVEESPCLNDWDIAGIYEADFDQDGNPNILTVRSGLDRYTVWRGDGDGHPASPSMRPIPANMCRVRSSFESMTPRSLLVNLRPSYSRSRR